MHRETFDQTIQITMEYNERDVSDDEQIVAVDEHDKDNEYEEPGNEPEEDKDEEPKEVEDEEENLWVSIRDEVKERQKKKLEASIAEFQKSGDSQEVAAVKTYNSLLPLYNKN